MTKPRAEVALLRLMKAVERRDCTAEEAFECFIHEYGGDKSVYFRKPCGLDDEMARITGLRAEVTGRFVKFVVDVE